MFESCGHRTPPQKERPLGEISFIYQGRIGGKGRPRFSRKSGAVYTPEPTRRRENELGSVAAQAMRHAGLWPLKRAVALNIVVTETYPKSWTNAQRKRKWIIKTPDADNIIKLIGDALNGIVWYDDSLIAQLHFSKSYGDKDEARISVCELA